MAQKLLLILLTAVLIAGCGKDQMAVLPDGSRQAAAADKALTRTVGVGSGDLYVDGDALKIKPGDVITITPGRYSSLTFANLNGNASQLIRVVANSLVEVVGGPLELHDVSYLTVDGGIQAKNLLIRDVSYRGIVLSGGIPRSLTLQGIRARNIGDYALYYNNSTTYDGAAATAFTNFRMIYCDFENVGSLQFRGEMSRSANVGFMKNPEIAYCSFRNIPDTGILVFFGNAESINIHHNVLDNINAKNNDHNGIFTIKGNGTVHHNKCTNHQGNFVRFWPFSQGTVPRGVLIHDNIVWNSRKYSAFEVQSFAENMIPGVSTYCNTMIYNNSAGRLNTTLPTVFVGVLVDVYNLFGGDLRIFNNLSFEQVKTAGNDGIWSQQSVTKPSLYKNNLYFSTAEAAGLSDRTFFRPTPTSPVKNNGLYAVNEIDDFYGAKRNITPSVGAVE